jgi:predicted protein tyrosine phosphatase
MTTIHVCPLHLVPSEFARLRPARLVTLLSPHGAMPERPSDLEPQHHLTRLFHDIASEVDDLTPPSGQDVQAVIAFAKGWAKGAANAPAEGQLRHGPMLIHCYAGISRSTAAALITALVINPDQADDSLVARLRTVSPTANPNRRMVSIADQILGRSGALVDAVETMDPSTFAPHGEPFELAAFEAKRG